MKTILYNPIFINPQAYYVFPRLTRWLRPDNGYKEPANYIGQIEVTIIAYGEIGYTEYFEHTNYIDFTNFSNSYVRISLFTRLGSCVLGEWKIGAMESDRPYIEPEVLASLKAVVIVGDKTNQDKDRDTVANLVDASNPFVISNASYNLNSGYGLYAYDFTKWGLTKPPTTCIRETDKFTLTYVGTKVGKGVCIIETTNTSTSTIHVSFKVKISGIQDDTEGYFSNANNQHILLTNGINSIEMDVLTGHWYGFNFVKKDGSILGNCNIVVEQIPEFQGAFITDGVNDLIMSTKTVKQMGITDQITVVSMIHQIALNPTFGIATTNYIENGSTREHVRSDVYKDSKTGIYGYSASLINNTKSDINNILGDKADYATKSTNSLQSIFDSKFSVAGRTIDISEVSSVAWYWTIIANKVLTTDQINQVIAYFNLDRTLNPDILCDVKKQGITNENHAEFGDKLIDFSDNGRDIQLNNIAWKGDSGIGKYEMDFLDWVINSPFINERTSFTFSSSNDTNNDIITIYQRVPAATQSFLIKAKLRGIVLYRYYVNNGDTISISYYEVKEGINILPDSADPTSVNGKVGFVLKGLSSVKVEQIPSHAGALYLDGVNDFGKVTGMPIYKDYTFISKYQRLSYREAIETEGGAVIASKSYSPNQGAFILNGVRGDYVHDCYSFGLSSSNNLINDKNLEVYYQTKYTNQGKDISSGTASDSDILWVGTVRDNDSRFINAAIYFLMSFPYSMSEFLIERQLKKYKLGTLYPDMVEFRPVIKANNDYEIVYTAIIKPDYWQEISIGDYVTVGKSVAIQIKLNLPLEVTNVSSNSLADVSFYKEETGDNVYTIYGRLLDGKSPQKINITIDEYIRFEDIVQPYPVLLRFKDENGNEVSWGDKIKVGSSITRIGSFYDCNLLKGIYTVSNAKLNGSPLPSTPHVVERQMVFTCTATYLLDDNEPKCILSPSRLRIPNSSYKLLGYIPDISGHGNNGVIHNSAYAEGSGVNEDGSYQFDGVDDFVAIPTLSSGGKQVLMKVNLPRLNEIIYDQRKETNTYTFAIITIPSQIAYDQRNSERITYIDGILNTNIIAEQLMGVTHNIVVINSKANLDNTRSPILGRDINGNNWSRMRIYDFMLFDDISTDDKILELNEYVGIEGNTE